MHILLFIIYSLLCIYGILKIPFIRNSGIRPVFLLLFFGLHVLTGLLHNSIAYRYYPEHGDIWNFYHWSLLARHRLFHDHALFLSDNDTWTHITHNGIVWIYMILNIVTFDSMIVNTLLFSFPVFLGNIALFRLFRRRLPNATLAAFTVFFLPSALFWTACIHREAVLYMLLGFLLYSFDRLLTHMPASRHPAVTSPVPDIARAAFPVRKYFMIVLTCLLLILYFRFSLFPSLFPALAAWLLAERRRPLRRLLTFIAVTLFLLFISIAVFPNFYMSVAHAIAARQQEFASLEGHSRLFLPVMDGTWSGIAKVLPSAIRNGLFEPLPGSGGQVIYLAFSFELLAIWLIIAAALFQLLTRPHQLLHGNAALTIAAPASPQSRHLNPFILFCVIFTGTGLILIGAMVPFAGTIVRYRSIFLPFLLAPALCRLHFMPLLRRLDDWLCLHLLRTPKPAESSNSY